MSGRRPSIKNHTSALENKSLNFSSYSTQSQKLSAQKNRSKKFISFKNLSKLSKKLRTEGKKIVFTTGTFDLLNPGHCRFLAEGRSRGDVLVVGVSPDYAVQKSKGAVYPLINQELRAELISYLKTVDYVTFCSEEEPHAILALLQPHIFFTSESSWEDGIRDEQEKYLVKSYGGMIIKRKRHLPYFGTTALVDHIANIKVLQILEKYIQQEVPNFSLNPEEHLHPADYSDQLPKYDNAFNPALRLLTLKDVPDFRNLMKSKKKKVVFVSGSYDLLHTGHARFIEKAGVLGDILVVGIPSDKSLRTLKGVGRPVISEYARAYVLANLDSVNNVLIFDDITVLKSLEALQPDVFFTVDESWNSGLKQSAEYKLINSYGGVVEIAPRQAPFLSSSSIINKVAGEKVKEVFQECMSDDKYQNILTEKSKFSK